MFKSFTPDALAIATTAKALAQELHYTDVGREHLLLGFASGSAGELIGSVFERCRVTTDSVRSAIMYIDGPLRPVRPHHVKYVNQIQEAAQPNIEGFRAISANQLFPYLTPNADRVFRMARDESVRSDVTGEDILRIFVREVGRSDDNRRVMQVLNRAAPGLTLAFIKSTMIELMDAAITEHEGATVTMKHSRMDFIYEGGTQQA